MDEGLRALLPQLLLVAALERAGLGQGTGARRVAAARGSRPLEEGEQPAPVVGVRAHEGEGVDAQVEGDDYGRK